MTKPEFMQNLQKQLAKRNVPDIQDVLQEYEDHFTFKLADGYSEEEIAAKLGDPMKIAAQYDAPNPAAKPGTGLKIIAGTGLGFVDIFAFSFLLTLYAFSVVLAALSAAGLIGAGSYLFTLNPFGVLPPMPYHCALLAAGSLLSMAVLAALGAYFWTRQTSRLLRAYLRYRRNFMAAATGGAKLPPYSARLNLQPALWRRLRTLTLVTLCVFVFTFVATYVVCAITAGSLEWWHVWNWFS